MKPGMIVCFSGLFLIICGTLLTAYELHHSQRRRDRELDLSFADAWNQYVDDLRLRSAKCAATAQEQSESDANMSQYMKELHDDLRPSNLPTRLMGNPTIDYHVRGGVFEIPIAKNLPAAKVSLTTTFPGILLTALGAFLEIVGLIATRLHQSSEERTD